MPKKIRATYDWGAELEGGSEVSGVPIHWTVSRGDWQNDSFQAAKRKAKSGNLEEGKKRWKKLQGFRKVFDEKALKEFQHPEGMFAPKFAPCEKVWVVRPNVWDPFAAKGIICSVEWCYSIHKWKYAVGWYERVKDAPLGARKNQYFLTTRYFWEEDLYKYEDKLKARDLLIGTLAKIYKWVADFEDRLHKLKPGDLKDGDCLK